MSETVKRRCNACGKLDGHHAHCPHPEAQKRRQERRERPLWTPPGDKYSRSKKEKP